MLLCTFLGPLKKVKKLYVDDPSIPVPKRTLFWKASIAKKSAEEKEERAPLNPFNEASNTNQDMLKTTDQELNSLNFESVSLVEEQENLSNGGSTLDLENNEHRSSEF